jgi:hypothetical protein
MNSLPVVVSARGIFLPSPASSAARLLGTTVSENQTDFPYYVHIYMIKLRRMRWAGDVTRVRGKLKAYIFWQEKMKNRHLSKDIRVDERVILKGCEVIMSLLGELIHLAQDRGLW